MVSISGMHKRYVNHKHLTQAHNKTARWEAEPRESWEENVLLMGGPFPKDFYEIMVMNSFLNLTFLIFFFRIVEDM